MTSVIQLLHALSAFHSTFLQCTLCLFVFIQDSSYRQARVGTTDGTFREHSCEDGCVDFKSLSPNRSTPVTVDSVNQEKVHHPYL